MTAMTTMTTSTYRHQDEVAGSEGAAQRIVPVILDLVGPIASVVDVGGGTGAWLREFQRNGVPKVLLVDVPAVRPSLLIDPSAFLPADMSVSIPALPRMDLAMSLECAEHLPPAQSSALVDRLASAADVVVFSAAIPSQGGKGHINERPPAFWAELFAARGFTRRDVLRPRLVHHTSLPWWYRQNLFLYTAASYVPRGTLARDAAELLPGDLDCIHVDVLARMQNPGLRTALRMTGASLGRAIRTRLPGSAPSPARRAP